MRVVLCVGTTRTAAIDDLSAAGANPRAMVHTPAADVEIVTYGRPVGAPVVPVSPTGCPTPALVTRAVRELIGFDLLVLDAGLATPTRAPVVDLEARPGGDIRDVTPVPEARAVFDVAKDLAARLPEEELVIGESIPGGTTTALGVLRALGEPFEVSSSLPENPIERKHEVVADGLAASGLDGGDAMSDPIAAVRQMGDPVLAAVAGVIAGATESGTAVTLAGGTQLVAAAAIARHAGIEDRLTLATTCFVDDDGATDLHRAASSLSLDLVISDPGFEDADHPALTGYARGEVKEGVAMGGALHLADRSGIAMATVRQRFIDRYETVVDHEGF